MEIVTVSPKYQVVIPLSIRKALGLKPGQKVELRERDGKVELVPQKPITAYRGFIPGINTDVPDDPEE
jgi:AbrB family looped-hinge helix DNA binding protein